MLLSNSTLVGSRFSVAADATSYWEARSKVPKVGKPSAVKPIIRASHMVLDLACYLVHSASDSSYSTETAWSRLIGLHRGTSPPTPDPQM
jgi:hypothetical protein